jgi:hypothetical protein
MSGLMPRRSRSATLAAILLIITAFYWLALGGMWLWLLIDRDSQLPLFRRAPIVEWLVVFAFLGACGLIAGTGLVFRRNWGRLLAIVLSGPAIVSGWIFLRPLLRLPASMTPISSVLVMNALPILTGVACLGLLIGKRVRPSLLPPARVVIYVNLLDEGTTSLRATQGVVLGNGLFELLAPKDYDPHDKRWEFRPGSIVRGIQTKRGDASCLLAVPFERS